jgi:hypothetical protein
LRFSSDLSSSPSSHALPPSLGWTTAATLDSLFLSQIFPPLLVHQNELKSNLVCAVMIAMPGLAQNLEQFLCFIYDCCLLGFLPLSQNKSLFRQGENETSDKIGLIDPGGVD